LGRLSRAAWLYIGTVVAVAALAVASGPFAGISWSRVAVLAVLFLAISGLLLYLRAGGPHRALNKVTDRDEEEEDDEDDEEEEETPYTEAPH